MPKKRKHITAISEHDWDYEHEDAEQTYIEQIENDIEIDEKKLNLRVKQRVQPKVDQIFKLLLPYCSGVLTDEEQEFLAYEYVRNSWHQYYDCFGPNRPKNKFSVVDENNFWELIDEHQWVDVDFNEEIDFYDCFRVPENDLKEVTFPVQMTINLKYYRPVENFLVPA